ncbi:hypothetical protein HDU92_001216 [Lobulomyces angularis]|nr:hypothetical protein HDU92_001216 [Lobulomyces angularis]
MAQEVFSDVKDKVSDAVDSAGSTVEQTTEKVTNAITIGAENVDLEQVAERLKNEFERIECDDKKLGVCLALSGVPTALFCVTSGPTTAGTTCVLGLVKFSFSAAICVEKNCNGVFSNAILGP